MIDARTLYVVFTMDSEQVLDRDMSAHGIWGPLDWAASERSIRRFDAILGEEGFPATYFIVPDTARAHAPMWHELAERGNELGLHLHAQALGHALRWDRFLGDYAGAEQATLLGEAVGAWESALGRRPVVFRPGNFSGSPELFPVLLESGLLAGSVALPGRVRDAYAAHWDGSSPHCHFEPAATERERAFLEAPVTASSQRFIGQGRQCDPLHLRVEAKSMDERLFGEVIEERLADPPRDPSLPRTLVVMTHNTHDYTDPDLEARLRALICLVRSAADAHGLRIATTTLEGLRQTLVAGLRRSG